MTVDDARTLGKSLNPTNTATDWSPVRRVLFRFVFAYLVLFIVPLPPLWLALVPWVGRHVFRVDASVRYWFQAINGAGDTRFHYVQVFCTLVLAAAAAVWTGLDRERANYARLHDWLRVVVRFFLALSGRLVLEGMLDGQRVRAKLHSADDSKLRLVRHGFHWVHEPSFGP